MIGKSFDQLQPMDFLLANWHQLASINPQPFSNPMGLSKASEPIRKKNTKMENHTHKQTTKKDQGFLSADFNFSL